MREQEDLCLATVGSLIDLSVSSGEGWHKLPIYHLLIVILTNWQDVFCYVVCRRCFLRNDAQSKRNEQMFQYSITGS